MNTMNTLVKCSLSAAILFVLPSCSLFDDEFSDPGSDEYSESFKSSEWNDLTSNMIPVPVGDQTVVIKDRLFPDEGVLYFSDNGETASICFESVIRPVKEYPDVTGFDGYGHTVALSIENIPVKKSSNGGLRFSRKTQAATLSIGKWACDVILLNITKDCKVRISGELKPSKTDKTIYCQDFGDVPANLSGDLTIKIITPDNTHISLQYKNLAQIARDMTMLYL